MSLQRPPRTLEIINPSNEAVLLFAVHVALDYEEIKQVDRNQVVNTVELGDKGNYELARKNTFSYDPPFGPNSITHALVTPADELGRTIFGFHQDFLWQSPVKTLLFMADALERGLGESVTVRYPEPAA